MSKEETKAVTGGDEKTPSLTEGLGLTKEDSDFLHNAVKDAVSAKGSTVSGSMLATKSTIDAKYTDEAKKASLYLLAGFVIGAFVTKMHDPVSMIEMLMSLGNKD